MKTADLADTNHKVVLKKQDDVVIESSPWGLKEVRTLAIADDCRNSQRQLGFSNRYRVRKNVGMTTHSCLGKFIRMGGTTRFIASVVTSRTTLCLATAYPPHPAVLTVTTSRQSACGRICCIPSRRTYHSCLSFRLSLARRMSSLP